MKKLMQEVSVSTEEDGDIALEQSHHCQDAAVIYISPEQVDTLVVWLQEAKAELLGIDAANNAEKPEG